MTTHDPTDYVRAAWAVVRRDPFLVGFRVGGNIAVGILQFGIYFLVGLALILVALGPELGAPVASPILMTTSAFGLWMCAFVGGFVIDAFISGGIWSVAATAARGETVQPLSTFLDSVRNAFSTAFLQLLLLRLVEAFLFATFGVVVLSALAGSKVIAGATGSTLVAPALVWAASLSLYAAFALVMRLSAAFVAPALFIDQVSFGEAMYRAAECVTSALVTIYRIFINAAVVLLVPLFLYWAAIMVQNISFEIPGIEPVGALVRFAGDIVLMLGLALFFIASQVAFFGFYAVQRGLAAGPPTAASVGSDDEKSGWFGKRKSRGTPPTLTELLPAETPNIVDLGEILGPPPERPAPDAPAAASESGAPAPADSEDDDASYAFNELLKPPADGDEDQSEPK